MPRNRGKRRPERAVSNPPNLSQASNLAASAKNERRPRMTTKNYDTRNPRFKNLHQRRAVPARTDPGTLRHRYLRRLGRFDLPEAFSFALLFGRAEIDAEELLCGGRGPDRDG